MRSKATLQGKYIQLKLEINFNRKKIIKKLLYTKRFLECKNVMMSCICRLSFGDNTEIEHRIKLNRLYITVENAGDKLL